MTDEAKAVDKCKCGKDGRPDHSCPFQEEINNNSDPVCNCCEECQHQCLMDI